MQTPSPPHVNMLWRDAFSIASVGVGKELSSRAQKLAAVFEAQFEGMVGEWRRCEGLLLSVALLAGDREGFAGIWPYPYRVTQLVLLYQSTWMVSQ